MVLKRKGEQTSPVPKGAVSKIVAGDGTPLVSPTGAPGFESPAEIQERIRRDREQHLKPAIAEVVTPLFASQNSRIDDIYKLTLQMSETMARAEQRSSNALQAANHTQGLLFGFGTESDSGAFGRLEKRVAEGEKHNAEKIEDFDKRVNAAAELIKKTVEQGEKSLSNQDFIIAGIKRANEFMQHKPDGKVSRWKSLGKLAFAGFVSLSSGAGLLTIHEKMDKIGGGFKAVGHAIMHVFGSKK